jgi:hypothetical protein
MGRRRVALAVAAALLAVAGCADYGEDRAGPRPSPGVLPSSAPLDTPDLDAIAVVGHSGATGTSTDPDNARGAVPENSWATGENPAVLSIYTRLLATHPALEGHNYNLAVNGSVVTNHLAQAESAMRRSPVPDVVLVQTIDNDMRCDGTDRQHVPEFASVLEQLIRTVVGGSENAQVFLVSQWASVELYARMASREPDAVAANSGTGPCDIFDPQGRPSRSGRRSLQAIVDLYWNAIEKTCARFDRCFTDGGALQDMRVGVDDVTLDYNHLSISGHRKFARLAWSALPAAIRERP